VHPIERDSGFGSFCATCAAPSYGLSGQWSGPGNEYETNYA